VKLAWNNGCWNGGKIEATKGEVPREVPKDVHFCLLRTMPSHQLSLRIKHSHDALRAAVLANPLQGHSGRL
jgi:hypothetical protein